jgi:hypothetical protein
MKIEIDPTAGVLRAACGARREPAERASLPQRGWSDRTCGFAPRMDRCKISSRRDDIAAQRQRRRSARSGEHHEAGKLVVVVEPALSPWRGGAAGERASVLILARLDASVVPRSLANACSSPARTRR